MITKDSLIALYDIEKSGVPLFAPPIESNYLENRIVSFGIKKDYFFNKNDLLKATELDKFKKFSSHTKSDIIAIIKGLNSEEMKQIEDQFVGHMFLTKNIQFFKKVYIKFFNPDEDKINNFLLVYFNDLLDRYKIHLPMYEEIVDDLTPFFSIIKKNLSEPYKTSFINYCIHVLLSNIDNGFFNGFLNWKVEATFNALNMFLQFVYEKNKNVVEKEKELLKPIVLSKIYLNKKNEEIIFRELLADKNLYFGNMKDVIFSILLEIPEFRKEYIKAQLQ